MPGHSGSDWTPSDSSRTVRRHPEGCGCHEGDYPCSIQSRAPGIPPPRPAAAKMPKALPHPPHNSCVGWPHATLHASTGSPRPLPPWECVSAEVLHARASALTGHEMHITIDVLGSGRLNARALPRRASYVPRACVLRVCAPHFPVWPPEGSSRAIRRGGRAVTLPASAPRTRSTHPLDCATIQSSGGYNTWTLGAATGHPMTAAAQ